MKDKFEFNEEESTKKIKRGAFMSYIAIATNILAALLYTPWMVEQIGQDSFGLYTLATSFISMFLLDFGLGEAVSRFVSKYNAEGDQDSVNNMLGLTYKIYLLIDLIIFIVLIVIYFNLELIYKELTPSEISSFKIVYIIAATFSVISFPFTTLNGILSAYELFVELKVCDLFHKISSVILIVIALYNGYGLYALVTVNAISGFVAIALKYVIMKRKTPVKGNIKYNSKTMIKEIFSFSVWSAIVIIAQRFIFNISPTILGAVSGAASIAIFGIASSLEGYVYIIAGAINGLFLPKISRIISRGNASDNLLQLMIKVGRIQLCIIGLITIGFICIGKDFVILWMGRDYILSFYSAILLILPSIIYLPQQIANTAIVALNKVKLQAYVFICMAVINILLSIVFSHFWGPIGASFAIFISYFIRSIGMNIVYYKLLDINIFKFFRECHTKLLTPMFFILIVGFSLNFILSDIRWSNIILKGTTITITYVIVMWIYAFNKYEKDIIISLANRIKRSQKSYRGK